MCPETPRLMTKSHWPWPWLSTLNFSGVRIPNSICLLVSRLPLTPKLHSNTVRVFLRGKSGHFPASLNPLHVHSRRQGACTQSRDKPQWGDLSTLLAFQSHLTISPSQMLLPRLDSTSRAFSHPSEEELFSLRRLENLEECCHPLLNLCVRMEASASSLIIGEVGALHFSTLLDVSMAMASQDLLFTLL